jgi:NADPH2:quinone reductase
VQLATWAGATVIATVSSDEKAARAVAGGAAHTINYRTEDVAARVRDITGGQLVDHVVDVDFGGNLVAALASVRESGSIAYYASNGALEPSVPLRTVMAKNLTIRGFVLPTSNPADRKRAQTDIARFVATPGRILPVDGTFPLYQTAAAHLSVEQGGKAGTVVVEPQK